MNYLFHRLVKYEYWGMSEMKSNQNVYYMIHTAIWIIYYLVIRDMRL